MGILTQFFAMEQNFAMMREELKAIYLSDDKPWCVLFSTGKDSTAVLGLVWEMLESLPISLRTKPIHVITGDTKVETPQFAGYVHKVLLQIDQEAKRKGLPLLVHVAKPLVENSFFYQVLGKGNPPPNERTRTRWCTDRLKIKPTDRLIREILQGYRASQPILMESIQDTSHDLWMLLGVRVEESANRKRSIEKYAIDETKFARHVDHPEIKVYHPIKFWDTDMVWAYILDSTKPCLPWGSDPIELYSFYRDMSGECPMTQVDGKQTASCGGNRSGCWTCCYTGKIDKMLVTLIDGGERNLIPLAKWKSILYEIRNDVRYREPFRRRVYTKQANRVSSGQLSLIHGGEMGGSKMQLGSLTHEARYVMLRDLLYIEQETGFQLIDPEEIAAILQCWREEGFTPSDVSPKKLDYDGPVVLKPDGSINQKETECPYPVFQITMEYTGSEDELVTHFLDCRRKTGKNIFYQFSQRSVTFLICEPNIDSLEDAKDVLNQWAGQQTLLKPEV